ncbi:hypothetical protein FRC12_018610 [Ceratobasidium sp. 428]|nr:hypothetical protein FRC12_018610 [Ceratobasidium sp. 428]
MAEWDVALSLDQLGLGRRVEYLEDWELLVSGYTPTELRQLNQRSNLSIHRKKGYFVQRLARCSHGLFATTTIISDPLQPHFGERTVQVTSQSRVQRTLPEHSVLEAEDRKYLDS